MSRPVPTSLSYFFPAYNEEGNLTPAVNRAKEVLPRFVDKWEIVIVDDGSRDGTEREGRELAAADPRVRYLRHETNRGYGEALRSGLLAAKCDAVVYTDGDLQFDLGELEKLWPLLTDSDIVAGYRVERADPAQRLFIAWTYHQVLRGMFRLRIRDVDCAFKLMRSEVARAVSPRSGGALFSAEFLLLARAQGFKIAEVGVTHFPRTKGTSKGATAGVIFRTLREMLQLRKELGGANNRGPIGGGDPD